MKRYEENPMLRSSQQIHPNSINSVHRHPLAIQVLFRISIDHVAITESKPESLPVDVSVCFKRGHKLALSSDKKIKLVTGQSTNIDFGGEVLSLVATLHKDPITGNYREKIGNLLVRRKHLAFYAGSGFKGLGIANLPLHRLIGDFQSQQFNIPLLNNSNNIGRIDVTVTAKLVGEVGIRVHYLNKICFLLFLTLFCF